jgi:hypothetical protein
MKILKVILLWEYENPVDLQRRKDRYKFGDEKGRPFWEKKEKEGLVVKRSSFSDNTRKMVSMWEFESAADFAKLWDDEEFHKVAVEWSYHLDNFNLRILRPQIQLRPA